MRTPPMGWMSWERFCCNIDCENDPKNYIRFPGGIAKLARYLHDCGLKLVIYGDLGTHTPVEGTLAPRWTRLRLMPRRPLVGVWTSGSWMAATPMKRSNRRVNYTLLGEICNLWRNYDDTQDSWDSVQDITDGFFDNQGILQPEAGPGRWNDPDMLIIGNVGLSVDQSRTQMALWAIMAAPLIMSNNLRTLSSEARAILQNRAAIAINQDPMGVQGRRLLQETGKWENSRKGTEPWSPIGSRVCDWLGALSLDHGLCTKFTVLLSFSLSLCHSLFYRRGGHVEVYWRPLSQSASALVSLSRRQDMAYHCHTSLAKLNYTAGSYEAYDVFTGKTLSGLSASTEFTVSINPSGVVMWYVYPKMHYEHPQDDGRYPYIRQKYRMSFSFDFHKPRVVPPSLL
ncbi:alpha-N-acetylgalactosaminidase-like [Oncorhynchus keta]|uniref:alpha-N-acetylgalactosaminidase-like n=1 Tax=Oncorhynchus keta TaxID=8018 RepID=UPI00227BF911|nr:alpha-N-acetylgalactosaminidase-like [Oncorhynchus keta]